MAAPQNPRPAVLMMLNKLTTMPTLIRLSLCLMTSAGIHGGVAMYDRASRPAVAHDDSSAVVVALVDTLDDPAVAILAAPDQFVPQDAVTVEPQVHVRSSQAPPVPPPRVEPASTSMPLDRVIRKTTAVHEATADRAPPAQPGCAETRVDQPDRPTETDSRGGEVAALLQSVPDAHSSAATEAGPSPGKLIEATPNYRSNPLPQYPFIARQRHWQGVVWLVVDVAANGSVEGVEVERSCGYRVLDRAASRTVKDWEFTPATRAGLPVESRVRIPVRFSLGEG